MPEAVWIESRCQGDVLDLGIVVCFSLGRRTSADGFKQAPIVEPVDPFQRRVYGLILHFRQV